MLKYQEIIDGLTIEQKLAILADASQLNKTYFTAKTPYLSVCDFKETANLAGLPDFNALLLSWDENFVSAYSQKFAEEMKKEGKNLAVLPSACVKNSPYSKNGTEDPVLLVKTLLSARKALRKNGVGGAFAFDGLKKEDLLFADKKPDESALNNYYYKAINVLTRMPNAAIAVKRTDDLTEAYKKTDKAAEIKTAAEKRSDLYYVGVETGEGEFDFKFPVNFGGNAQSVDEAYRNYIYLEKEIENGALGTESLNEALKDGLAISEDMINAAVDKVFEFAYSFLGESAKVAPAQSEAVGNDEILKNISYALPVLLKNQKNALPLKKGANVAIVGDVASLGFKGGKSFVDTLKEIGANYNGVVFGGFSRGYDLGFDRSDELESAAVELSKRADAILFFVGLGEDREERESSSLISRIPSNQLALLDKLKGLGKPIIAVAVGEFMPDGGFIDDVSAALFSPSSGRFAAEAVLRIVTGLVNPSGRLPYTVYTDGDERFYTLRSDIVNGRNKQGPIVGYRDYLTNGVKVKYPFGYGLSYSQFEYYGLKITGKKIEFYVKNTSKTLGAETAQIYLGKKNTAALRPARELKAFEKVKLNAGEKRKISVTLSDSDFGYYNAEQKDYVVEKGAYEVYVGASAGDIRLTGVIYTGSATFKKTENKADYLQSETNIVEGGYRLKTQVSTKNSHKKAMTASKVALIIVSVCIGLILVTEILNRLDVIDFDLFLLSVVGLYVQIIIGATLAILFITFLVTYKVSKNKYLNGEPKKADDTQIETGYVDVSATNVSLYDKLFSVEFAEVDEDSVEQAAEDGVDEDLSKYYERGLTLATCVKRLFAYVQNKGIDVSEEDVKKLVSAIGSSKLIILKGGADDILSDFAKIVSEFFFGTAYTDVVDDTFVGKDDLFTIGGNSSFKRNIALAVGSAAENEGKMCFATLKNVRLAKMSDYFVDLIQYFVNPSRSYVLPVSDNMELTVTPNFHAFILLRPDDDGELPQFLKDVQETVVLTLRRNGVSADVEAFPPSHYQFETLVEKARTAYTVSEDLWKRVDKLDSELTARVDLTVRNKAWTSLEKETSVYLAVGGEQTAAIDFAVAAKLVLPATRAFRAHPQKDAVTLSAILEDVFGDDNVSECKKVIRADVPVRVVETASETAAKTVATAQYIGGAAPANAAYDIPTATDINGNNRGV